MGGCSRVQQNMEGLVWLDSLKVHYIEMVAVVVQYSVAGDDRVLW